MVDAAAGVQRGAAVDLPDGDARLPRRRARAALADQAHPAATRDRTHRHWCVRACVRAHDPSNNSTESAVAGHAITPQLNVLRLKLEIIVWLTGKDTKS